MKLVCPRLAKHSIGILALTAVVAFSVQGQQPTTSPSPSEPTRPEAEKVGAKENVSTSNENADAVKPDPLNDYTFPTRGERFDRYVKDTVGPLRLMRTTVSAGLDQWRDTPEEWGQGMKGYGKRWSSSFGRNGIQQTVTYGLDSALGLDTGFQRSGREGVMARVKHAFMETISSRTKSGKRVISAPRLVGVYSGAIIASETWYPERYSYKDGFRMGTSTLITGFGINLVREFFINW